MNILFRADASSTIGSGHVMRCLAMAQGLVLEEHKPFFLVHEISEILQVRLESEHISLLHLEQGNIGSNEDAIETLQKANTLQCAWIILDGYCFDSSYQKKIKSGSIKLLVVDDYNQSKHHYADLILNPNIYAKEEQYINCESYTKLLIGTRYALLRKEFLQRRYWQREFPDIAQNILISLGGADPQNLSLNIIQYLQKTNLRKVNIKLILGPNNSHIHKIEEYLSSSANQLAVELICNAQDMPSLMQWADVAIASAGSTCWELAYMGLPSLTFILAANQVAVSESLDSMGIFPSMGWDLSSQKDQFANTLERLILSASWRQQISIAAQALVDGEGINRILMHLLNRGLRLQVVRDKDCLQLWEWANEPEVRACSFSEEFIPWGDHINWFRSKLQDQDCQLFLAVDAYDCKAGVVRFDLDPTGASTMSISLDKAFRGKGYGVELIKLGARKIFCETKTERIVANIKNNNKASLKAFRKSGFIETSYTQFKNSDQLGITREQFFST